MLANQYGSEYVTHVTKGIYSIDIIIPTNISNENTMYSGYGWHFNRRIKTKY
jgi:hypothetical protein